MKLLQVSVFYQFQFKIYVQDRIIMQRQQRLYETKHASAHENRVSSRKAISTCARIFHSLYYSWEK